ncbi:MAG: hypothetical protein HY329_13460 [Chloroflexi bacterium]|nr:hypothetical protein [Chloroflexota bacterium]
MAEQRGHLLGALLTLARAWFAASKPAATNLPKLGSFEAWAHVVGGVLAHAGVIGFLQNLEELYETVDDESAPWGAFLAAWRVVFAERGVKTSEVTEVLGKQSNLYEALPDNLTDSFGDEKKLSSFSKILGKALAKRRDTRFDHGGQTYCLRQAGTASRDGAVLWKVTVESGDPARRFAGFAGLILTPDISGPPTVSGKGDKGGVYPCATGGEKTCETGKPAEPPVDPPLPTATMLPRRRLVRAVPSRVLAGLKELEKSGAISLLIPRALEVFLLECGITDRDLGQMPPQEAWRVAEKLAYGDDVVSAGTDVEHDGVPVDDVDDPDAPSEPCGTCGHDRWQWDEWEKQHTCTNCHEPLATDDEDLGEHYGD